MMKHDRHALFGIGDRREAERLLGTGLPAAAAGIRYLIWQPSGDLAYSEALLRFDASHADYLDCVRRRGLVLLADSGPTVHVPVSWAPPPEVDAPDWWQPSAATPPDAAGGPVGRHGSIAVKWENGHVYALIVDTGHRAPD
jgi:hypothetical protein